MDSIFFQPKHYFYSAEQTMQLVKSSNGDISSRGDNKFKIKPEYIFIGVLVLGGFLTAVVVIAETQRKVDRKKQFAQNF